MPMPTRVSTWPDSCWRKRSLSAASTNVFHLPSTASNGGSHAYALNASALLDDLTGGCDCGHSPGGQGCDLLLQAFEHCGHYLVGEFELADGRAALMIHNQDPDGAQWPTVDFHPGIDFSAVLEVDPVHGTLAPVLDSSPLMPGLQLRIAAGMARLLCWVCWWALGWLVAWWASQLVAR